MKYCLGTVQFGMNYGIQGNGQPQRDKVNAMLSYAIEHGISVFDTASAYGEAEEVLGGFIRTYPEQSSTMRIVSKLRPDAFLKEPVEKWKGIALKNARDSLGRLGIEKFQAYLFHNAAYIFDSYAVEALSAVKSAGLTDRIGVSIYTPNEAMKALEYPQVEAIQIPYNVFDRRLDKCHFFEKAMEQDVTVYARSSLLQGLVMMNPEKLPDRVSFARDYLCRYLEVCQEYDIPPLNAAIGYVASKKGVDYIVFGVDNIEQLEEYLAIEDQVLPDEMLAEFDSLFYEVEEKLVNPALWNK